MSYNFDTATVISDGNYQYFRPSMINLKKQVESEIKDYNDVKIKATNLLDSVDDLTMVDHPFDRLCFVRNKFKDLGIQKDNKNAVEIMVLLGIEHKLTVQLKDVQEFRVHYQMLIQAITTHCNKCKFKFYKIFQLNFLIEKQLFPLVQEKEKHERKLEKFEREYQEICNLMNYIRGKILFLSESSISKLGLLKD